jgi:hypothetical protein
MSSMDDVVSSGLQMPELSEELQIKDSFFDSNVSIDNWELGNSNQFSSFINDSFVSNLDEQILSVDESEDTNMQQIRIWDNKNNTFKMIRPFKHQLFVKNYLNTGTPYRGLLLYHGLGSGKSGASVIIAESFNDRQVVILLPASLESNYKTEIQTFGSQSYKKANHWVFVPFNLGKGITKTKDKRTEIRTMFENIGISKQILNLIMIKRKKKGYASGIWLINTLKNYPNYITEEEKRNIEASSEYTSQDSSSRESIEILSEAQKIEIDYQIDLMYNYKYKFIHTNAGSSTITSILKLTGNKYKKVKKELGLTKKDSKLSQEERLTILDRMYTKGINPFDNKLVVVDEVHNLASAISGNGYNAPLIYELLMRAKNCKFVLLSGTPVINNAYELAIICNLLKGFTISYEFTLLQSISDMDAFHTLMKKNKKIYTYIVEQSVIKIITNPKYFSNTEQDEHTFSVEYNRDDILLNRPFPEMFMENMNKTDFKVEETYTIQYYSVFNDILTGDTSKWRNKDLRIANITSSEISDEIKVNPFRLMSSKHKKKSIEAFSERYINANDLSVTNVIDFKKRILGIISFYNEVATRDIDNPIFPDMINAEDDETNITMSNFQFKLYVIDREKEREYETLSKKLSQMDGVFSTANLFKVYSRTLGIMVFPPTVSRPRHSQIKNEVEAKNPGLTENPSKRKELKKKIEELYVAKCYQVIDSLTQTQLQYENTEELYNLNILSPKYTLILKNIFKTPGLVFGYSQFRSIEGIGLFSKVLAANGYYLYTKHKKEMDVESKSFKLFDKVRFETVTDTWETYTIFQIDNEEDMDTENMYHIRNVNSVEQIVTKDQIFTCYFSLWTGEEAVDERRELLRHFNEVDNKYGTKCLILLTTSAGAEGISLMNVRQVHIMEPYWNNVRIKQVIGRARRVRSHNNLPLSQRNVKIFQYIIRFTTEQLNGTWTNDTIIQDIERKEELEEQTDEDTKIPIGNMSMLITTKDGGLTSDETLYNIANNKSTILDKFLKIFKEVAIDCTFNESDNKITNDVDVTDTTNFNCYKNLEEDKEDSLSLNIFSEHSNSDLIVTEDSSVVKEIKKKIIINQPTLANNVQLHSIILDVPEGYTLRSYLQENISFKIPVINFYSYYGLHNPSKNTIIGFIIMNPDSTISLTNIDTSLLTFEHIKEYMLIEKAIKQIDSSVKSPLMSYSQNITPAETAKWSSSVKEKITELKQTQTWSCKICKETYSLEVDCCVNHPRMTKKLFYMLKDKQLKKKLRLLS